MPNAKIAYATFGTLNAQRDNAILVPSWYGADHHGYDFLIGTGLALDPAKYFIVATEMFANGFSSSPSNTPAPFDRSRFPAIAIRDNVAAARRVLTEELRLDHLRAVVGFSMGAQQAFQWAVSHPDFVDAIVGYCGTAKTYPHGAVRLESAISGPDRGQRVRQRQLHDAADQRADRVGLSLGRVGIRRRSGGGASCSSRSLRRSPQPCRVKSIVRCSRDPNNLIAQARTWQRHNVGDTAGFGGDVEKALRSIRVPVLYMPSATDLYFPVSDAEYERAFIQNITFHPIPSLWGHRAGGGRSPEDARFLNTEIGRFLEKNEGAVR